MGVIFYRNFSQLLGIKKFKTEKMFLKKENLNGKMLKYCESTCTFWEIPGRSTSRSITFKPTVPIFLRNTHISIICSSLDGIKVVEK